MCLIIENGAFAENLGGEALSRVLGLASGCFLRQAVADVKANQWAYPFCRWYARPDAIKSVVPAEKFDTGRYFFGVGDYQVRVIGSPRNFEFRIANFGFEEVRRGPQARAGEFREGEART